MRARSARDHVPEGAVDGRLRARGRVQGGSGGCSQLRQQRRGAARRRTASREFVNMKERVDVSFRRYSTSHDSRRGAHSVAFRSVMISLVPGP
eukprot:228706-Prymnesium_polylepis.1